MNILVTGGFGFIGSNLIKELIKNKKYNILNIDKITNSSMPESLDSIKKSANYKFIKNDICNFNSLEKIINNFKPNLVIHLAAESHVDNSIESPSSFINTNIIGTYNLLKTLSKYITKFPNKKKKFKFIHISTDEVYGSLKKNSKSSKEHSSFLPNSPYSASKASSDLLVRAWNKTYDFPTITTNCCNNYGPYQFPEKMIPKIIRSILLNKKITVYGNGMNIREWIHVDDHIRAIIQILKKGRSGSTYNIGSGFEINNINLTKKICMYLDKKFRPKKSYKNLITYVKDRKGHDYRYSLNSNKIFNDLNFKTKVNFEKGITSTIEWYFENKKWLFQKKI